MYIYDSRLYYELLSIIIDYNRLFMKYLSLQYVIYYTIYYNKIIISIINSSKIELFISQLYL